MSEQKRETLAAERDALGLYFEALLGGGVEVSENEEKPQSPEVRGEGPDPLPEAPTAPPVETLVEQPGPVEVSEVRAQPEENTTVPAWGEGRFQAMLFRVAGLTLAVPLVELSGVREWDAEQITPMPGHVSWYLGLMPYRGHNVPVVDTAELVLPAEKLARLSASPDERLQRVVFIEDGRWGLACDEVAEVVTLGPEQVRWRSQRTVRRWLAGTVLEQMCAIIDPPEFARLLATGIGEKGIPHDE